MQNLNTSNSENTESIVVKIEDNCDIQVSNKPDKVQKPFKCKYCPRKYKVLGALKNHEQNCIRKKNVNSEKQHRCKDCGHTFKYAKILQKHEAMHKGKYPFWCKLCMLNFATHEDKVVHKMNEHPSRGKKHKCKLCPNKKFDTEEEYLFHINEVHKGKFDDYYMCSDCGKQFKTKSELTHHINSKCGTVKQYQCKVCNQFLMTAGSLHNHMLRHTGEQGCMCWYCGKTFLTVGQLKVHERTHTQEKAFVCDVCGKGFCHRQSLITHSTLHTGVKPYQCENCGHSFSCVGNLIKHRRTHADSCGKTPLTSHRVNNPSTKMKVKINTPDSSKLKTVKKEKELQKKLAAYKEKLNVKPNSSDEAKSDHSSHSSEDVKYTLSKNEFEVKPENVINTVPYIPNNFLQTNIFEEAELKKDYVNRETDPLAITNYSTEPISNKYSNNLTQQTDPLALYNKQTAELVAPTECSNSYVNQQVHNWGYLSETSSDRNTYSIKHFPPDPDRNNYQNKLNLEDTEQDGEHYDDYYDSEDSNDERSTEEVPENNINNSQVNTKPRRKPKQQDKISEQEFHEFLKQRGLENGNLEASCQYCKRSYSNMRWLLRHEKEHEKEIKTDKLKTAYKCSCCKTNFETREACKVHQQDTHADILTCQECDKLFSNVDSLRSHQNIFHKGLPRKVYVYVCEKCGLQFRQKAFLSHHEMNNCGAGPIYECHVCGKGFNSVHTRRSHLRIHDPKKRFLCKFCGKSFRWKGQLKVHERSHTGEKPFKCLYCPKAFGYRESLVTHSSLHTGIKPHLCQACGSRFSCIGNLIKHRATHASTCGVWYSKNQ